MKSVNIELGDLTQHNLKQLKVLNRDVFPVAYNEKFYKDLLGAGELCKLGKTSSTLPFLTVRTRFSLTRSESSSMRTYPEGISSFSTLAFLKFSSRLNKRLENYERNIFLVSIFTCWECKEIRKSGKVKSKDMNQDFIRKVRGDMNMSYRVKERERERKWKFISDEIYGYLC